MTDDDTTTPMLITVSEAAKRLGFAESQVREMMRNEELPVAHWGRKSTRVNWLLIRQHVRDGGVFTPRWWES